MHDVNSSNDIDFSSSDVPDNLLQISQLHVAARLLSQCDGDGDSDMMMVYDVFSGGADADGLFRSPISIGDCVVSAMKITFLKNSAPNTFNKHLPLTHQN